MQDAKGKLPISLAQGAVESGEAAVARVYWLNPATIGDTFMLTDGTGHVILSGRCEVANQSQFFDFSTLPIEVNGIGVGQLSSGTLYIYNA